jgi:phosphatidylglycerophosphate synthase
MLRGSMASELEKWSRGHAALVLGALGVALYLERTWPVAAVAVASLAALVTVNRNAWTPSGVFGWANTVTALRALAVWVVGARLHGEHETLLALIVLGLFALDGLDGYLARRRGTTSEFGALFDMETDAYFVLMIEVVLFHRGDLGAWILVTGVLRYVYVLVRAFVPARRPDVPRSRFGRLAFTGLALGLFFAFALPGPIGQACALVGTVLVTASFARSFYDSYARGAR